MLSLPTRTELSAGSIAEAVLSDLPEAVFGRDGWATTVTRGLARELVDAVASGCLGPFGDAVRIASHVPAAKDVRAIANAVCDAAGRFVAISGQPADGIARRIDELRSGANEILDRTLEQLPDTRTPETTVAAAETLLHLMAVSRPDLRKHADAVTALSLRIARQLDIRDEMVDPIRLGGQLHDIGLLTMGTEPALAERDPGHASLGDRCISGIEALRYLGPIVRSHHERFDGAGGPDGLRGAEIPIEARIIAVADAFEHLANRAGRSNPVAAAISDLWQESGAAFDPDVVAAVTRIFNQHWRVRRRAAGET